MTLAPADHPAPEVTSAEAWLLEYQATLIAAHGQVASIEYFSYYESALDCTPNNNLGVQVTVSAHSPSHLSLLFDQNIWLPQVSVTDALETGLLTAAVDAAIRHGVYKRKQPPQIGVKRSLLRDAHSFYLIPPAQCTAEPPEETEQFERVPSYYAPAR